MPDRWAPSEGARIRTNGTGGHPPRRKRIHPAPACNQWGDGRTSWGAAHDEPIEQQVTSLRLDATTIERVVRAVTAEQGTERPIAIDSRRVRRRKRQLALEHAEGRLTDQDYLRLTHAVAEEPAPPPREARATASEAVAYLRELGKLWDAATEQERADLLHVIYARITVTRDGFVEAELTPESYAHGLALSMRESVTVGVLASPAGFGAAGALRRIVRVPIVGKREWLKLARSA